MGRRKKTSGRSKKRKKTRSKSQEDQGVILPLSRWRLRIPHLSEEWSPWYHTPSRRKRVKVEEGYRWRWLPSSKESRQRNLQDQEKFYKWKQEILSTTNP